MNTPTHALLNLALLGRGGGRARTGPVLFGALLPDLPMLGFWLVESLGRGVPQRLIWDERYFDPAWQHVFDAFNSFPVYAGVALLAWWRGWRAPLWVAASAVLHLAFDLPLHREDAHAHFWPLSGWHFVSPVSYWDRAHYGAVASAVELGVLVASALVLARRTRGRAPRAALAVTVGVCAAAWGLLYWAGLV